MAGVAVLGCVVYFTQATLLRWFLQLPEYETDRADPYTVAVKMRDGTALATHVYKPVGDGPWPTVLIRDPYSIMAIQCRLAARYGYACVHQDVRGRYGSQGEWHPVIHERDDGLDTLDWLIQQPWQNGNIATLGGSYVGLVQWAMIDAMPPEVKTVVADVSHGDWYKIIHRGGHMVQGVASAWALSLRGSEHTLDDIAQQRPMVDANTVFLDGKSAWYTDYVANPDKQGDYWQQPIYQTIRNAHKQASMPVLMSGGWHDFFIAGQYSVFEALPRRKDSLLFIRNGSHGISSIGESIRLARLSLKLNFAWLAKHLKGRQGDGITTPGYLLQDNADEALTHYDTWPDAASSLELHLSKLDEAQACDGGALVQRAPERVAQASYRYEPSSPVPSLGGSYHFGAGVVEQGDENCARQDVLSFGTEPFARGFKILGSIAVQLAVSSDAADTAFTVKLQEKLSDGRVLNIRDDITSLSYDSRNLSKPDYVPGTTTELQFKLTPIQWTVRPGSTLRLDISSSNFPFYNAHPNTLTPWYSTTETNIANQTLIGGELSLPLQQSVASQ